MGIVARFGWRGQIAHLRMYYASTPSYTKHLHTPERALQEGRGHGHVLGVGFGSDVGAACAILQQGTIVVWPS